MGEGKRGETGEREEREGKGTGRGGIGASCGAPGVAAGHGREEE